MKWDDYEDYEDERPRRSRRVTCSDQMCGALDCLNCHPNIIEPESDRDEFEKDQLQGEE